jgi:signal transduction histidine kinase
MIVPMTARGRVIGALAFGVTSSARRFTEDDLALAEEFARRAALAVDNARLYERAREAAALRADLVAVVAHDLKSPLSVIQAGATFVLDDLLSSAPDTEAARQQVDIIYRTAERMHRLIHDLLDASALEAGQLVIDPKPERADTLLREAVEALEPTARAKSTKLILDVPDDRLQVLADRERVLQVFSNLGGNAIKFTPPGGEVRLAVRASAEPGRIAFSVSDTGPGIAPGDQPHVFERFWKGKAVPGAGTGLGLTIAKGIVEAHGGRIRLFGTRICGNGSRQMASPPVDRCSENSIFWLPISFAFLETAFYALTSRLVITFAFITVAVMVILTWVEAYVALAGGVLFLGFGGMRATAQFAENYLGSCSTSGRDSLCCICCSESESRFFRTRSRACRRR